jgi:hypothetical protein
MRGRQFRKNVLKTGVPMGVGRGGLLSQKNKVGITLTEKQREPLSRATPLHVDFILRQTKVN